MVFIVLIGVLCLVYCLKVLMFCRRSIYVLLMVIVLVVVVLWRSCVLSGV